ncbi:hypothetical protein ACU4GR_00575 [Methylobacterium oryzae CBMB20]
MRHLAQAVSALVVGVQLCPFGLGFEFARADQVVPERLHGHHDRRELVAVRVHREDDGGLAAGQRTHRGGDDPHRPQHAREQRDEAHDDEQ